MLTQYILLHQSLKKVPGAAAAQAAHAATECLRAKDLPVPHYTTVVVLEVDSSESLHFYSRHLASRDIHHVLIHEPDEPYNGAATALGVVPMEKGKVGGLFEDLKVFR